MYLHGSDELTEGREFGSGEGLIGKLGEQFQMMPDKHTERTFKSSDE